MVTREDIENIAILSKLFVAEEELDDLTKQMKELSYRSEQKVCIVTDSNVAGLYAETVKSFLQKEFVNVFSYTFVAVTAILFAQPNDLCHSNAPVRLQLCQNFRLEEFLSILRLNGMGHIVNRNADAFATLAHAELAGKLYLIAEIVLLNKLLELIHNALGTQQMAGAAYTNRNLHDQTIPFRNYRFPIYMIPYNA